MGEKLELQISLSFFQNIYDYQPLIGTGDINMKHMYIIYTVLKISQKLMQPFSQ